MLIGNKSRIIQLYDESLSLEINNSIIQNISEINCLGIIIDENWNYRCHAVYVMNKVYKSKFSKKNCK